MWTGATIPFAYGHGYVNGNKWRDIMSYKAACGVVRAYRIGPIPGCSTRESQLARLPQIARGSFLRACRARLELSLVKMPQRRDAVSLRWQHLRPSDGSNGCHTPQQGNPCQYLQQRQALTDAMRRQL